MNEQNLRPCEHKFTQEEAKKGAKKTGEVRWSDIEKDMWVLISDGVDENGDIIYKYNKDVTFEPCMGLNKEEVIKTRV